MRVARVAGDPVSAPTIGRVVHVRIGTDDAGEPILRPATIVRTWSGSCVNVVVQLDGTNDTRALAACGYTPPAEGALTWWVTSISEGEGVMCWRWPARVP